MNTQSSLQLELHIPDFELAKKFYMLLGFEVIRENPAHGDDGYLVLKNESGCIINFWSGTDAIYDQPYFKNYDRSTKRGYGVEVVISTKLYLKMLQAKLIQAGYTMTEKLIKQPWGLEDFRIEDPFGYYLRITTVHDIVDPNNAVD